MLDVNLPFRSSDAEAAGITAKQLRGPRYRRLFSGVHVSAGVPDHPVVRALGALLACGPAAVASHTTAAAVYGLPVPRSPFEHVTVGTSQQRSRRQDISCHVGATEGTRMVSGVRVASPEELFVQLASMLDLVELVVVGDSMVRRGLLQPRDLVNHCQAARGRNVAPARRAAAYVRARVDSPMESRVRMLLVLAGLPEPCVNLDVRDATGMLLRRYDLGYPAGRLAVEYDGRHHAERVRQWEHDISRREEIDDDGWRVIVLLSKDIYVSPAQTVERVWRALRAAGHPGLPRQPSEAWRPYFGRR